MTDEKRSINDIVNDFKKIQKRKPWIVKKTLKSEQVCEDGLKYNKYWIEVSYSDGSVVNQMLPHYKDYKLKDNILYKQCRGCGETTYWQPVYENGNSIKIDESLIKMLKKEIHTLIEQSSKPVKSSHFSSYGNCGARLSRSC